MTGSIQKLIDDYLKERNEKRRVPSGKFNPSLLGRCYRLQYWKRKAEEPSNPVDERTLRVFEAGHLFHEFIQRLIDPQNTEVAIETDHFFGYADIVTDTEVIDIKSQHSRAFWYMKKEGYDINQEKKPNILQVVFYAKTLQKPRARLVFVSKDDLCISEHGFFVSKWQEELDKEIDTLVNFWKKEELPPAEPRAYGGKECKYCMYKDKCKEKENAGN